MAYKRPGWDPLMTATLVMMLAFLLPSSFATAGAYTHCRADEKVVYSCSTGSRVLSICASPNLSTDAGYMQYRYGRKDHPEFIYPDTRQHPAGFFVAGSLMFSGGGGTYLQFKKGSYTYTVFSAIGK